MALDKQTIAFYNKKASDYATWSASIDRKKILKEFIDFLPPNSKILDYGCGTGWATEYFVTNGFKVTALDGSKEMLKHVIKNNNVKLICGDFLELNSINEFNGVWASFSLQHAEKNLISNILNLIKKSLKKNGIFYLGIHEGEKVFRDSLDRFYCYYNEDEITKLLQNQKFEIFKINKEKSSAYDGSPINIMNIFLKSN